MKQVGTVAVFGFGVLMGMGIGAQMWGGNARETIDVPTSAASETFKSVFQAGSEVAPAAGQAMSDAAIAARKAWADAGLTIEMQESGGAPAEGSDAQP